ncbi:hypothetical protein LJB68_00130 [bacterium 210820-DFI.6.52]|nr:hypothetical protein [bacterium 210820-DFI.6.52]
MVKRRVWLLCLVACCALFLSVASAEAPALEDRAAHVFDTLCCLDTAAELEQRCDALYEAYEFDVIIVSEKQMHSKSAEVLDNRTESVLRNRYGYKNYGHVNSAVLFLNTLDRSCELRVWGQLESYSDQGDEILDYDRQTTALLERLESRVKAAADNGYLKAQTQRHREHLVMCAVFGAVAFLVAACFFAYRRQKQQDVELRQQNSYKVRSLVGGSVLYCITGKSSKGKGQP